MDVDRYRFTAEWFDPVIKVKRLFLLSYFPSDGSVEMYDTQSRRMFLKRLPCSNVDASDMYVGSVVNILSRQLHITGFGDDKTKALFGRQTESTLAIIKASGFRYLGRIFNVILENGMSISKGRMCRVSNQISRSSFARDIAERFGVFELRGDSAIDIWKNLLGVRDASCTMLKAELGELASFCLGPTSERAAKTELDFFFGSDEQQHSDTSVYKDSTCCIIKPHALHDGSFGHIIQDIYDAGFEITALEFMNFDLSTASEFYEVYKGTIPEYKEMVAQLMSGPCIGMEIVKWNCNSIVEEFRSFVGPMDAELAKKLRPTTLRGKYGSSLVKNAVHCTDLPEDGRLEVDYLFPIMGFP